MGFEGAEWRLWIRIVDQTWYFVRYLLSYLELRCFLGRMGVSFLPGAEIRMRLTVCDRSTQSCVNLQQYGDAYIGQRLNFIKASLRVAQPVGREILDLKLGFDPP